MREVTEVIAVSTDADDQILILFRMLLCGKQGRTVKHIDRQLLTAVCKIGLCNGNERALPLFGGKQRLVKLHLCDKARTSLGLVIAHHRLERRGGSVGIAPRRCRNAVGIVGVSVPSAVGKRRGTEPVVRRAVEGTASAGVHAAAEGILGLEVTEEMIDDLRCHIVHLGNVVSELRAGGKIMVQLVEALVISIERADHIVHGIFLIVK